jgi:hypothetical protein
MKTCNTCQYHYRPIIARLLGGTRMECHHPGVNARASNHMFAVHGQFGIDCLGARRLYCLNGDMHEEKES